MNTPLLWLALKRSLSGKVKLHLRYCLGCVGHACAGGPALCGPFVRGRTGLRRLNGPHKADPPAQASATRNGEMTSNTADAEVRSPGVLLRTVRRLAVAVVLFLGSALIATATPIRVVSQTVGTDELLLALAEPDQVASLSHLSRESVYSAVAEEAKRYPMLEKQGDVEGILKFQPTLVLFANYSRAELVTQVKRAGVKVLIFDRYRTLEDAYENLRILGRELGAEDRAEKIIADCQRRVAALEAKLKNVKPIRVIAPSTYGVIGGDDTTFQDLCDHAAADNLAATLGHLHGHEAPPNEQMLTWPIDKVVVAGESVEAALAPFKKLPPYQFMAAVKENRAALLKPYQLSCVTHRRIDGYETLARALHPELFP